VVHAQELELKGRMDQEQLAYAVSLEISLFSFNVKDFVLLHNRGARSDVSIGVLWSPNRLPSGKPCGECCDFCNVGAVKT
jgi:hypothetical protein